MEAKDIKEKKQIDKKVLIPIIGIIIAIIAVGISFAVWNYAFTGQANTISTAEVSLDLLESNENIINITNALPMSDNEGKAQTDTFDFAVTSKTTKEIDVEYNINIEKLSVDNGYTSLNDNQIKVYLTDYNNTQKVAPTLVSNLTNYKLYTGKHSHDATHETVQDKFKLRVWIDGAVDASNWNQDTKLQYKFKIGVSSEEHVDVPGKYTLSFEGTESMTQIGQAIPNDVTIYNSGQDAINAWTDYAGSTKPFYLKHVLNGNNEIEESYIEFVVTEQMAQANPGMVVSTYALKGGDSGAAFTDNMNTLKTAFDYANHSNRCWGNQTSNFYCYVSGLDANANSDGNVNANDGDSYGCNINSDGSSNCYDEPSE